VCGKGKTYISKVGTKYSHAIPSMWEFNVCKKY